jgi:hypothetical protein
MTMGFLFECCFFFLAAIAIAAVFSARDRAEGSANPGPETDSSDKKPPVPPGSA